MDHPRQIVEVLYQGRSKMKTPLLAPAPPFLDNARAVCEQDIEFANYKGSVF